MELVSLAKREHYVKDTQNKLILLTGTPLVPVSLRCRTNYRRAMGLVRIGECSGLQPTDGPHPADPPRTDDRYPAYRMRKGGPRRAVVWIRPRVETRLFGESGENDDHQQESKGVEIDHGAAQGRARVTASALTGRRRPHSSGAVEEALATTPRMAFPGVQYAADTPWMLSVHDVERHVRAYASLHGLNVNDKSFSPPYLPVTSYSTKVEAVQKCNDTSNWTLTLHRLQWLPESSPLQADWWTEDFDAVVDASGRYAEAKNGQYSMYHSQLFRHPERLAGKTILIVGNSVSATQIFRTIASFAHLILASSRPNNYRDGYGLDILFSFGDKAGIILEILSFEPLRGSDIGIKAGRIKLINGTMIEGIDEIILATGYHTNTFLPDLVNPETLDNLHWTGHYIHDPTLAYILSTLCSPPYPFLSYHHNFRPIRKQLLWQKGRITPKLGRKRRDYLR
ncbi:hypothetical protein K438DRAFT_1791071 [Mycena galopus ATCC 62051]|nr:hypothetical protein K438DRAFT_1791071 [Mycena galopus ATCC 62051]